MAEIKRVEKLINKTQVELDVDGELLIISVFSNSFSIYSRQNLTIEQSATNEVSIRIEDD